MGVATSNSTLQQAVVKPAATPEARPGHSLVVYEESAQGRRFFKILAPGEFFKAPFLTFGKRYLGYWVIADPHLKLSSLRECKTRDHLCTFTLATVISYRIQAPEQLVERLDIDPMARLLERAEEIVLDRLENLDWQAIKEGGAAFRAALWSQSSGGSHWSSRSCLEQLRTFALDYGIEITDLNIERSLPDGELKAELQTKEIDAQRDVLRARSSLEFEQHRHDQGLKVYDTVVESVGGMLNRAGESVDSYAGTKRALEELTKLGRITPGLVAGPIGQASGGRGPGQMLPGGEPPLLSSGGGFQGEDQLSRWLAELCGHFDDVRPELRYRLAADCLHFLAETVRPDGNSEELSRYARSIADLLNDGERFPLPRDLVALLRKMLALRSLGRELRGQL